ncbi:MAG: hypothetical protein H7Y17_01555 [Chlorobia bacterium]|nr:hypothetical protein [Fimbriimonadaceae bacterium]
MNNLATITAEHTNGVASTGAVLEKSVADDIGLVLDSSTQRLATKLPLEQQKFLARLFDPMAKAQLKGKLKIQERELAFQIRSLDIVREAEARILATLLSHFLREGKSALQARSASFVLSRELELMNRVEETVNAHQANVIDAWNRAATLPTELQQVEKDRISEGYERLVGDVNTILNQFSEIVAEVIPASRD